MNIYVKDDTLSDCTIWEFRLTKLQSGLEC